MTSIKIKIKSISSFFSFLLLIIFINSQNCRAQVKSIILGRPTTNSITASVLFDQNVQFYFEYGTQTGLYSTTSTVTSNVLNVPDEIDITNLIPNTQYYYRMQYKLATAATYTPSPEYKFHTQRAPGSSFTFTVEADEHLYDVKGNPNMYKVTLANELADNPDFMLSLGDTFGDDHTPTTTTNADMDALHKDYRQYLGEICHSVPFYFCLGNHEGENDYYLNVNGVYTTATNLLPAAPNGIGVWGTNWRKYYYPNPFPNNFYTGNTTAENYGIGIPENYYSWTWGDALFVVLDVYRTEIYPGATPADGSKPQNWDWTLGYPQYQWMRNVLETSTATHKFVFAHHTRGQGRGGIGTAAGFEWGGIGGNQYSFDTNRPGWGKPIHQVFLDTGVDIFFQGHDHLFAKEQIGCIPSTNCTSTNQVVYQEVPMPSDITYNIGYTANANAYPNGNAMNGTGHIRVNVTPSCVTVDYVKAYMPADATTANPNGEVAFTYTLGNCALNTNEINKLNFQVYPNPVNEKLIINFENATSNHHFELVTILGQIIAKFETSELNTSAIPNGIYFLKVDSDTSLTKKIIIKH